MRLKFNERFVEVELDKNADKSRYVTYGYYLDYDCELLTDDEIDQITDECDDEINALLGN